MRTKPAKIKAACREAVELSAAPISQQPEKITGRFVWDMARTPYVAQALLTAIEALEQNAKPAIGGKFKQYDAQQALRVIAEQWPDL